MTLVLTTGGFTETLLNASAEAARRAMDNLGKSAPVMTDRKSVV